MNKAYCSNVTIVAFIIEKIPCSNQIKHIVLITSKVDWENIYYKKYLQGIKQ